MFDVKWLFIILFKFGLHASIQVWQLSEDADQVSASVATQPYSANPSRVVQLDTLAIELNVAKNVLFFKIKI